MVATLGTRGAPHSRRPLGFVVERRWRLHFADVIEGYASEESVRDFTGRGDVQSAPDPRLSILRKFPVAVGCSVKSLL